MAHIRDPFVYITTPRGNPEREFPDVPCHLNPQKENKHLKWRSPWQSSLSGFPLGFPEITEFPLVGTLYGAT